MSVYVINDLYENDSLCHHGIKGQKWGVRRFQNPDGTYTEEGKKRYFGAQRQMDINTEPYSGVHIRRAERKDLSAIIALVNELDATDKKYLALNQKYPIIRQTIRNGRHCFVASRNGEVIGFLRESGRPEGYSMLEELIVSPRFRNMGIATMMMDYYHNEFPKNMAKTNSKNKAMIHLLTKLNYKVENIDAPRILNWKRN